MRGMDQPYRLGRVAPVSTDLNALAVEYWNSPPYEDHVHDTAVHAFDTVQDLVLDADPPELSDLLRELALAAPSEKDLAYVGTTWVVGLEYRFDAEGSVGESIRILLGAGLPATTVVRVLSGVAPDWLAAMGAPALLADVLEPAQIAWLVDPAAACRRDYL